MWVWMLVHRLCKAKRHRRQEAGSRKQEAGVVADGTTIMSLLLLLWWYRIEMRSSSSPSVFEKQLPVPDGALVELVIKSG